MNTDPLDGSTQEVRFAVVMYGGVSLAIYINGVAQELLRMVRATAPDVKDGKPLSQTELSGSERVYRKVSQLLAARCDPSHDPTDERPPTRFVIDAIAGTSAGGINGVFLAKALANGQNIDELQQLWVREGAIEKLLNDRRSVDPPLSLKMPPTALLNGQRMYFELLKAFDGMDAVGTPGNGSRSLVDELDLFVTSTDLRGITLPIRLADEIVFERRHRNVLHFVYSKDGQGRNDFVQPNNPFLAYAARCTSSFPFAFEPMTLRDIDAVLDVHPPYASDGSSRSNSEKWQHFFRDYAQAGGLRTVPFPRRSFADGGDLDNKPFSFVIDTLSRRVADVPVQRKLIYIEPSPEHPEDEVDIARKPDFLENVLDALSSLPRYETIREDLQRVVERNRLIIRLNRIMEGMEEDELSAKEKAGASASSLGKLALEDTGQLWSKPDLTDAEWATLDLGDMLRRKGRGYIAYNRMEIAALTDELANLVARVAGLDEDSDDFLVIRALVQAWRERTYTADRTYSDTRPTMNSFIHAFDLSYPLRRLRFLQQKADQLYRLDNKALPILQRHAAGHWRTGTELSAENSKSFRDELRRIKRDLKTQYDSLRKLGRNLRSRYTEKQVASPSDSSLAVSPIYQQIQDLIKVIYANLNGDPRLPAHQQLLDHFLGTDKSQNGNGPKETVQEQAVRKANELLSKATVWSAFQQLASKLEQELKPMEDIDAACLKILGPSAALSSPASAAHEALLHYYQNYDDYDMIMFPILYGTDIGEAAIVEVFRVSPEDAKGLINERSTKCRKLAGTALGHFGAFLEKLWRQNDILWGRLDGAERIITALLPANDQQTKALIGEAQADIVLETIQQMGTHELNALLCESLMRTGSGEAEPDLLCDFISKLKCNAAEESKTSLGKLIDDSAIRQYYLDTYDERSRLNPQATLETAARATTIVGHMFEDLAKQHRVSGRSGAFLARFGQFFWGFVEVSVPRTIPQLLFRYWLKLLYLFETLLIIASTLLSYSSAQKVGLLLFGITLAVNIAVWVLENIITMNQRWIRVLAAFVVGAVVLMIAVGVFSLSGLLGFASSWSIMQGIHGWYAGTSAGQRWWAKLSIAGFFIIFYLWTIRHDLFGWWNKSAPAFEPISIQPVLPNKSNVRNAKRFLFLPTQTCDIRFTLSSTPPWKWRRMFRKKCKESLKSAKVRLRGSSLRLFCAAPDLQKSFRQLKDVVKAVNDNYQLSLKTSDTSKVRTDTQSPDRRQEILRAVNELDYS